MILLAAAGALGVALAACAADDPGGPLGLGAPAPAAPPGDDADSAGPGPDEAPAPASPHPASPDPAGSPVVVPDGAVDLTGRDTVTIVATDNRFRDRTVVVSPGTRIVWVNEGRNDHNVYPADDRDDRDAAGDPADGSAPFEPITTDELEPGEQAVLVFDRPGDFPYYCTIHGTRTRGMVGRIIVVPEP